MVYRAVSDIGARRLNVPAWGGLILAGLATLPTTLYQYWAIRSEPVFYQRALVSATWSPQIWWLLLGFGFVLLLAVIGALTPAARARFADTPALRLLLVWAVVGIAVAYVPVAFQRKLLMGEHLPLCVLAGATIAALTAKLSGNFPRLAAFFTVVLCVPSNLLWLQRDMDRLDTNVGSTARQPYLTLGERDALRFLHGHAQENDNVLVSPDATAHLRFPFTPLEPYLSVYVPAYTGCVVYNGHWSETAQFEHKYGETMRFFRDDTPDTYRIDLLGTHHIHYLLYDNRLSKGSLQNAAGETLLMKNRPYTPVAWAGLGATLPPYLSVAFQNADVTVYLVSLPTAP